MNAEFPEELGDAFKAAALSVTKLYKTSARAQAKARADGYQDCLEDLLAFLDKEKIGLGEGEGWRIRSWATERADGRESITQTVESEEDDVEKAETVSSPELHRRNSTTQLSAIPSDTAMRTDSAPPHVDLTISDQPEIVVPSQETFNFQSHVPYPQESSLTLANLELSDSRANETPRCNATSPSITIRSSRVRHGGSGTRSGPRSSTHIGRGVGQKRKLNLQEIFDLGSIERDSGSRGSKRNRHA